MTTEAPPTPEVHLIEWFNDHYYKVVVGDKTYHIPSVTTKLGILDKPSLARWRGDVGNREADMRSYEASQRGKRIHWAYETFLKGGAVLYDSWQNPIYSPQEIKAMEEKYGRVAILRTQDEMHEVSKLKKQFDLLKPNVLAVEIKVFDTDRMDAGTIDNVLEIKEGTYQIAGKNPIHLDAGIYINDLKTGSYLDDRVWYQLAPYTVMYEKIHNVKVAGALVTHTGSTIKGGIEGLKTLVRTREQLINEDYPAYRNISNIWMKEHEGESPKEFTFPSLITIN